MSYALCERAPVPRERWHAWVDVIAQLHADVCVGLDVLDADDEALRRARSARARGHADGSYAQFTTASGA